MNAEVYVGHHCPKCGTTIGLTAQVGGTLKCPGCGGNMQAASGGPEVHVLTNVHCKHCNSRYGTISIVGGKANCPGCGKSLK